MIYHHGIHSQLTIWLRDWLIAHPHGPLREAYKTSLASSWQYYAVNQDRGRCYYGARHVTIPVWCIGKDTKVPNYLSWYCSHEISHIEAGLDAKHGPVFMSALKRICPAEAIHFEVTYKPREVIRAGINIEDILKDD